MPVKSDDPLRKVTLNLYEADCQWLEKAYGRGWTERIRQHIHNEVQSRHKPTEMFPKRLYLGDLNDR
jgi:hypothetical protein